MQCLERGHRGGGDRLSILPSHLWKGLHVCSLEAWGVLMCPLQLLMGNMSLATLLAIPPQALTTTKEPTPLISCPTNQATPRPSSGIKWWHHSPNWVACLPQPTEEIAEISEEPLHQKWKDRMPLKKLLKGGQWEAFAKDSDLVQQAREAYFRMNQPEFNHKYSCLGDDCICWPSRFQDLQNPGSLNWVGWLSVHQWCIEAFAEGSAVFLPCIPFRIAQGHGLKRGSPPRCPLPLHRVNLLSLVWEGRQKWRNSGQPLVDKLGLVCGRCLHFPSITSEAIWHHSWGWKQPRESDAEEEDGGPDDRSTSD